MTIFTYSCIYSQNGLSKSYYADGTVRAERSYVNDIYDGTSFWFYPNGNLQTEKTFSLGKLNGTVREYYESGLLKEEYSVSNGVMDGVYKSYYDNGQLKEIIEYKLGKRSSYQSFPYDSTYRAPAEAYQAGNRQLQMLEKKNQILICDAEICPIPIDGLNSIQKNLVYPEHALMYGLQGTVTLIATVDTTGNVTDIEVIKHLGLGCDEAAAEAVKKTRFIPGQSKGKYVVSHVTLNVEFSFNEQQNQVPNNLQTYNNKTATNTNNKTEEKSIDLSNQVKSEKAKLYYDCNIDQCAKPSNGLETILKNISVPSIAKRLKLKGDVIIEVTVDRYGIVRDTKVIEGIGYGCDDAVESAIFATKFDPGKNNNKVVDSKVTLTIPFDYSR